MTCLGSHISNRIKKISSRTGPEFPDCQSCALSTVKSQKNPTVRLQDRAGLPGVFPA